MEHNWAIKIESALNVQHFTFWQMAPDKVQSDKARCLQVHSIEWRRFAMPSAAHCHLCAQIGPHLARHSMKAFIRGAHRKNRETPTWPKNLMQSLETETKVICDLSPFAPLQQECQLLKKV